MFTNAILLAGCILFAQVSDRYNAPTFGPGPTSGSSRSAQPDNSRDNAPQRLNNYDPYRNSSNQFTNPYSQDTGTTRNGFLNTPTTPSTYAPSSEEMHAMGIPSKDSPYGATQDGTRFEDTFEKERIPKPAELMVLMLTPPQDSRLVGRPTSLSEVVAGANSRRDQTQRVEAYWDLCSSVSDYYLGLHEQQELRRLRPLFGQVGDAWRQAEAEMGVRVGTAERAAIASQYRLARLMGRTEQGPLPLPADMPHCGDYFTRHDDIFASRPSKEAADLDELLPLRYDELKATGIAVVRAEQWLDWVASRRSEGSDGTGAVKALELLALRRRAFVQIARDYNRRIARYAELAAPGQLDGDQLVGMLIKPAGDVNTATRRNSPRGDGRQSRNEQPASSTLAGGWTARDTSDGLSPTDAGVIPTSAIETPPGERVERSVLVQP